MPTDVNTARYAGKTYGAPPPRHDETVANMPDALADAEAMHRAALVAPASWNEDALTFEATFANPHPVRRRDSRGQYLEVLDAATVDLSGVEGLPVYDDHRGGTARQTIGIVMSARKEGETIAGTIRLSLADDVTPIRQRVAEGTIRHVSVGYRVTAWAETRDDAGNRIKTPTAWALPEVSLVPNTAGLGDEDTDNLIDTGATVAQGKATLWDHVQTRSASRPVIRTATVQNDDPAVIVRRQADAVATRMSGAECPDDARQYLGEAMLDLARSALEHVGQSHRGMTADEAFHRAAHTTADFPLVVSNAMGKTDAQAYQAAESPLKTLCRQRVLRDFKTSTSIRLGGRGRLEELAENGEITHTSRASALRLAAYIRDLERKIAGQTSPAKLHFQTSKGI